MEGMYVLNPFDKGNSSAMQWQYDGRWTPEKAEEGIVSIFPRASLRTYDSQNGERNDLWIRSSQFFRLKNLEIGYSFDKLGPMKKIGMSSARIYLSGNNLYTWGAKMIDGIDPELLDGNSATYGFTYPFMKSYNIGINIQF